MTDIDQFVAIVGPRYALTGAATAPWAKDWTGKYCAAPALVLRPQNTLQVSEILSTAHRLHTPVTPVGGLTGLVGGAYAPGGIMLSLDRLNEIYEINQTSRTATVGAGVILSALHDAAEENELVFPLTFGAKGSAMIGGAISTNAGGSNVLRYGNTRDLVLGLEAVLADGQIVDLMSSLRKDNSGLNLRQLLVGSEGTLGVITKAVLKLAPKPQNIATAMVATPDLNIALTLLNSMQDITGGAVEAFEFMPRSYIDLHLARIAGARPPFSERHDVNILLEAASTTQTNMTEILIDELSAMMARGDLLDAVIAQNETQRAEMWARREAAAELTFWRQPIIDMDVALPLDQVSNFLSKADAAVLEIDAQAEPFYIAHLGDGNVHYAIYPNPSAKTKHDVFIEAVENVVADLGGSFSAEHGIGLSKLSTMRRRKDPTALNTMRKIKCALDPNGILNPGKLIPE